MALALRNGWNLTSACTSKGFCSSSLPQSDWSAAPRRNYARIIVGRFQRQNMDFDERISGSNMYLPSCTYYVSGADFSGLPHYLTQSQSSCPVTYQYQSSALPQVPSVRDVAFRDYGIDTSSKWHHSRGSLSHCYTEDIVQRDGWTSPSSRGGEILVKGGSSSASHPGSSNPAPGFYGSVGRNGVLPQAFDQFFDTAYGSPEHSTTTTTTAQAADAAKTSPAPAHPGSDTAESFSPKSSSGHSEEKQSKSSSEYSPALRNEESNLTRCS